MASMVYNQGAMMGGQQPMFGPYPAMMGQQPAQFGHPAMGYPMGPGGYPYQGPGMVPMQVEGCDEAITEAQAIGIYVLRSRQTCNQTPMELAAAGRSSVVAEMFRVQAKTVRDIWTRKCWSQSTKPYWTEHEGLMHACDKEKQIRSNDTSPAEINTPFTPDTPNSVATAPPPLSASGSFISRDPSSASIASQPPHPPSRQGSFARRRRHSMTSPMEFNSGENFGGSFKGNMQTNIAEHMGGSKRNVLEMVADEDKPQAQPPQPRSKRRASFSGDVVPSELADLREGVPLCDDINVKLAPPIQPSWAVQGSGFFQPLGEPVGSPVDRTGSGTSVDRSSSSSSKKSLLPPPVVDEPSSYQSSVPSAVAADERLDKMQEDATINQSQEDRFESLQADKEMPKESIPAAIPVAATVQASNATSSLASGFFNSPSPAAAPPSAPQDSELHLRLSSVYSDASDTARFSNLAARIPSSFSDINANSSGFDFSRLRDASAGWNRADSAGLGRVRSEWLRALSAAETPELPLHLDANAASSTNADLMQQLDELLQADGKIHVVPEGEFEPSETHSETSECPSMEDVGAREV